MAWDPMARDPRRGTPWFGISTNGKHPKGAGFFTRALNPMAWALMAWDPTAWNPLAWNLMFFDHTDWDLVAGNRMDWLKTIWLGTRLTQTKAKTQRGLEFSQSKNPKGAGIFTLKLNPMAWALMAWHPTAWNPLAWNLMARDHTDWDPMAGNRMAWEFMAEDHVARDNTYTSKSKNSKRAGNFTRAQKPMASARMA